MHHRNISRRIPALILLIAIALIITACARPAPEPQWEPPREQAQEQPLSTQALDQAQGEPPQSGDEPALGSSQAETSSQEQSAQESQPSQKQPAAQPASPTPPPPPSPTPAPQFSLSGASQDLPENIMEEIYYFGGQGGGGDSTCVDIPSGKPVDPEPGATITIFTNNIFEYLTTCGWQDGETVVSTFTSPNGDVLTTSRESYGGALYVRPPFTIYHPMGTYLLHQEGSTGVLESSFEVVAPDRPTVVKREEELVLYGFQPEETVMVLAYTSAGTRGQQFTAWQEYKVNLDGNLAIQLPGRIEQSQEYFVIGMISGDVRGLVTCSRAYPTRLKPGMQAQVVASQGTQISDLPRDIGFSDAYLSQGSIVTISDGPICSDFYQIAWQATDADGSIIYLLESDQDRYYLSPEINAALQPAEVSCPEALATRLSAGQHARVTFTNGLALRVRSDPGYDSKIRRQIDEGTEFDIVDGPKCVDETYWWKIETAGGERGWVAEGQDGEYYIEPWQ